jgi:hypothetical protein
MSKKMPISELPLAMLLIGRKLIISRSPTQINFNTSALSKAAGISPLRARKIFLGGKFIVSGSFT